MKIAAILVLAAGLAPAACIPVASDKILARDLVQWMPAFAGLEPDTVIGFTPLPGVERVLPGKDLTAIARRGGINAADIPGVCIIRAVHPISREEMMAALVSALGAREAQIELLDFSSQPLPSGRLEFQRSSLNHPPPGAPTSPVIWRGRLVYDGGQSIAVWAKVTILLQRSSFVAAEDISSGCVIRSEQVKTLKTQDFPSSSPSFDSVDEIIGRLARRNIQAGQHFTPAILEEAKDVHKGDIIQVRVIDGQATLSLDAIAQSSGNKGDTVLVHNAASGRNFRAIVEGKAKAVVRSEPEG